MIPSPSISHKCSNLIFSGLQVHFLGFMKKNIPDFKLFSEKVFLKFGLSITLLDGEIGSDETELWGRLSVYESSFFPRFKDQEVLHSS